MQMRSQFIMRPKWAHMNLINCLVSKPARIARSTPQLAARHGTWYSLGRAQQSYRQRVEPRECGRVPSMSVPAVISSCCSFLATQTMVCSKIKDKIWQKARDKKHFIRDEIYFVANKMFCIPCFLSYLVLNFRTDHCLGSKETTTWTTYAYSYCSVLCRESCRPCRWAVRLRGGVGWLARGSMGNILRIQTYMILLIYILSQSLQWSVQYHVTWDYVITPL